jgi:hypothetical protein
MSRPRVKCAHCKRRVGNHEPDLVLRDLDSVGKPRYFHTTCGHAAYAAAAAKPSVYHLTVRHVEAVAN